MSECNECGLPADRMAQVSPACDSGTCIECGLVRGWAAPACSSPDDGKSTRSDLTGDRVGRALLLVQLMEMLWMG